MKLTLRKGLIAALMLLFAVCLAFGIAACNKTHNFSEEWSYDNDGHWHACTDSGCSEKSDYAAHTTNEAGTAYGTTIYYTCSVCGGRYTSTEAIYIVNVLNVGGAGVEGVQVTLYDSSNNKISTETSGSNGIIRFRNLTMAEYTAVVDSNTIPAGYSCDDADLTINFTADVRSATLELTPGLISGTMPSGTKYSLGSVMYDFETTVYYNYFVEVETENEDGTTTTTTEVASETMSLSDYLENYDAVVLNFFYSNCGYCIEEFPYINAAYNYTTSSTTGGYYYERIAFICVDYTGQDTSLGVLKNFLTGSYAYDNVAYIYDNTTGLNTAFSVSGWPTTVVIDSYGVVTMVEKGYHASTSYWANVFEGYLYENYVPDYSSSNSGSSDSTIEVEKPNVDMPESGEIADAIVNTTNSLTDTDTFAFSAYEEDGVLDEYSWPWLVSDGTAVGGYTDYIYTSNANKLGTYAILVIDVKLEAGQVFTFDYYLSTEVDGDYFYIQVDTVLQAQLSGEDETWTTFCYVAQYSGYYQITLTYQKNTSVDYGDDRVYVRNMYLAASSSITSSTVLATSDLLYNAATPYTLSTTTGSTQSDYGAGKGYANYVSVYLASDGYYRVDLDGDNKDGDEAEDTDPYLLADLYYTTPWNSEYSIWNYASAYLYADGSEDEDTDYGVLYYTPEYCQALEDYAWVQTNCPWGYVPVDSYLAEILKEVTKSYGTTDETGTGGQYANDNQWLEVCRYFIHYGATDEDHACKSTTNLASAYGVRMAEYVGELSSANTESNPFTFHANIETAVLPRGYYYSFTVETSGVYKFYTTETYTDEDGNDINDKAVADTYAWITDSTGHLISDASNDTYDLNVYYYSKTSKDFVVYNAEDDEAAAADTLYYNNNFCIYVYLEADTTYMMGAALSFSEDTGEYDVYAEYLGTSYSYFSAAVYDDIYTYSYDETTDTYTYYNPSPIYGNYSTDDNGYYYTITDDGAKTPIYINMTGITWLNSSYSSYTIEQAIEAGVWTGDNDIAMKYYLKLATDKDKDDPLYGYVQATYELVGLLNAYINGSSTVTSSDYSGTAWLMTAYYERVINESSYSVSETRVIDD